MGRPRKQRPKRGADLARGMSERDLAATGVMSRAQLRQAKAVSDIPKWLFEELIESDSPPTVTALARLGRAFQRGDLGPFCTEVEVSEFLAGRPTRKPGEAPAQGSRCPHCGGAL